MGKSSINRGILLLVVEKLWIFFTESTLGGLSTVSEPLSPWDTSYVRIRPNHDKNPLRTYPGQVKQ